MYDEPFAGLDPISLNVIATLIWRLNDALGLTSIIVTYDVSESLKLVDYGQRQGRVPRRERGADGRKSSASRLSVTSRSPREASCPR